MNFALLSTATTIAFDLPLRADATPTFVVKDPSGGAVQSSTSVTLDTVNTTVSGSLLAGASGCVVTSATGIVVGQKYIIGNTSGTAASESTGGEKVIVKSISGTSITFVRPLMRPYTTGPLFQSPRVSCAVAAASIGAINRHYRIEVTWNVGSVAQDTYVVPFDVTRYKPVSMLAEDDIADLDPIIGKRLPANFWWPTLRDAAWDELLRRVAAKVAPGAIVGAIDLTAPHRYLCRELIAETNGEQWEPYRQRMAERFLESFDACLATTAIDNDQDGALEPQEGWSSRSFTLVRS